MREILRKREEGEKRRRELEGLERAQREHSLRQLTQEEARNVIVLADPPNST